VGSYWKDITSSTTKVDNEPQNGSNDDITNQYECKQNLDVSACTLNIHAAMTSDHNSSELGIHDHSNELSSSKLVPKVVPPADKTATSRQELELLFHHHITMLSHKVVRLGINPMIQPEPEDLPKDNPKLEIAVLRYGYRKNLKKTVKTRQTRTRERKSTQRAKRMLSKVNSG
ncbi:hypothetical protein Tco_0673001, partial [Tanacetum coccineum]